MYSHAMWKQNHNFDFNLKQIKQNKELRYSGAVSFLMLLGKRSPASSSCVIPMYAINVC